MQLPRGRWLYVVSSNSYTSIGIYIYSSMSNKCHGRSRKNPSLIPKKFHDRSRKNWLIRKNFMVNSLNLEKRFHG